MRILSAAAGRTGAGRRLDAPVRKKSRSRENADVRRCILFQGFVRYGPTCVLPALATPPTTWTSRRGTVCWSSNCATRARSFSPKRSTPNITAAPAIPAGRNQRRKSRSRARPTSAAAGSGNAVDLYDTRRAASLGSSSGWRCRSASTW